MKRSIYILATIFLTLGCVEQIDDTPKTGDIIGSVSDKSTGEPVATVITTLTPGDKRSVTGSDGAFEYTDLEPGSYTVNIEKEGYKPASGKVTVKAGEQTPMHLLIERIPVIITPDRDVLDFGEYEDINTLSFSIVNSGYEDLDWSIEHNCKWIKEVKPAKGTLAYGKTESIIVLIDRDKLNIGENESIIVVRSTHGRAELKVKATGVERVVLKPDCQSLDFGDSESLNKLSFSMTNSGRTDLDWSIEYDCKWISNISPSFGKLSVGSKETVVVTIDRDLLNGGENETIIIVRSTHGRAELKVSAIGIIEELPVLNTLEVTDATSTTAVFNAEIVNVGSPKYTERGFVYSINSNPTLENTIEKLTAPITASNKYSVIVSRLEVDTKYYVRAYAKNELGIAYSTNEVSFEPVQTLPVVVTDNPTNKYVGLGRVTFNGNITYVGDPAYTEHGFVYGPVHNPTVDDDTKKVVSGKSEGVFSSNISGLEMNTIYYVRAYATNNFGTAYGAEKVVDMSQVMPVVSTKEVADISATSATFYASLDSVGDPQLSERGFIYGTMPVPTIDLSDAVRLVVSGSAVGDYTYYVSNLTVGTAYYVRAYAMAEDNVSYGDVVSFTAQDPNYIVLHDAGIMVQKEDIGKGDWNSVKSMCENSTVSGYADWRLPDKDELMVLYNNKDNIGGFTVTSLSYYWSSTYSQYSSNNRFYINFFDGDVDATHYTYAYRARCVRTINSSTTE